MRADYTVKCVERNYTKFTLNVTNISELLEAKYYWTYATLAFFHTTPHPSAPLRVCRGQFLTGSSLSYRQIDNERKYVQPERDRKAEEMCGREKNKLKMRTGLGGFFLLILLLHFHPRAQLRMWSEKVGVRIKRANKENIWSRLGTVKGVGCFQTNTQRILKFTWYNLKWYYICFEI